MRTICSLIFALGVTLLLTAHAEEIAGTIFKQAAPSVVTVEGEQGRGTGFLVDTAGFILTNDHVLTGSRSFSVEFDADHRYEAEYVVSDSEADVAILLVNKKTIEGLEPLQFASISDEQALIGAPVFAIGSPLSQKKMITSGVVSQVTKDAIISDVGIDHGNSGGPLLNADGKVLGITTFGEGRVISGIIRIEKAMVLLEQAKTVLSTVPEPSEQALPNYPEGMYPIERLKELVLSKDFDFDDYTIHTRLFDILIMTPPALAYFEHKAFIESAEGRTKRRKKDKVQGKDVVNPLADIREWNVQVGKYKPVVTVYLQPKVKATIGSSIGAAFIGSSVLHYRYKSDFDNIVLKAGEKEQPYIKMYRVQVEQNFKGIQGHMEDVGFGGSIDYLPAAFGLGSDAKAPFTLEILHESKPDKPLTVELDKKLLDLIKRDMAPAVETKSQ